MKYSSRINEQIIDGLKRGVNPKDISEELRISREHVLVVQREYLKGDE